MTDTLTATLADAPLAAASEPTSPPPLAENRLTDKSSLISPIVVRGAVRLADFALTVLLGLTIGLLYVGTAKFFARPDYTVALALTGIATVISFELSGLYSIQAFSTFVRQMPRVVLGWTVAFGFLVSSIFFFKAGVTYSRVWLALWFFTGMGTLLALRLAVATFVRHWARQGRLNQRTVIFGSGPTCEALIAEFEADPNCEIRICGIFDDRGGHRVSSRIAGYPKLGRLEDLIQLCRQTRIDLVIVALPLRAEARLVDAMNKLSVLPVDIKLPARATELRLRPRAYSHVGTVAMIDLLDKPIADWDRVSKWLFDKIVGTLAFILLAPVMAAVAIAIKLDSKGPVFFRQKRYGFNNELIEVYKFRSMYTDRCDAAAAKLVTKDDPRVTKVGRIIRKTSLDELPQLINVLKGELSLVGPRPHALQAKAADRLYDEVVDGYFARHRVKPGITGWAQINGWRGETDTPEKIKMRVEHDLYYIENWSVFLDLYILLKTPLSLMTKTENAY